MIEKEERKETLKKVSLLLTFLTKLAEKSTIAPSPGEGSTAHPSTSMEEKKQEEKTKEVASEEKKEVHNEVKSF